MSEQNKPTQSHKQNVDWLTRNVDLSVQSRSTEEINAIRRSLDEQEIATRARMSERIFVGLWLPVFAHGKNEYYPQVNLDMWANFAGNEYREVDVVDVKSGQVLFTVPPLFDRSGVTPILKERNKIPGGSITNVIKNAELRSKVSPRDGQNFLHAHLQQRAIFMSSIPPSVRENILRWNAIFKRYNLPPIVEMEEVTQQTDSVSDTSSNQQVAKNDDWELL